MNEHKVIVIVGPTASGKTGLSLRLAEKLGNAEIVSADSRQIYRYMNIGTAKPTKDELEQVRHHFIDIRNPDQEYSAGEYGREARACIAGMQARGVHPIVVGGSGFYIQALLDGLFAPKISDAVVKEKWQQRILEQGIQAVFEELRQVDPDSAERLHPNDVQRIVRALEVFELSGTPISKYKKGSEEPCEFTPVVFGLNMERQQLYNRINERVVHMVQGGLLDEVRALRHKGYSPDLNALRSVGYQEVFDHFAGLLTFMTMVETIQRNSRRYAKRQLTWFRKDERIRWMDPEEVDQEKIVKQILKALKEK